MSNFRETFLKGKEGKNFGLTTGITALDQAIHGIQKKTSYGLAAAQKVGKTTLLDYCWVLSPYLEATMRGTLDNINWIYYSFEIDRVSKEFKFAAFFMAYDFGVYNVTYKEELYGMSQDYLMGKMVHKNKDGSLERVPITEEHEAQLKEIYVNRIVPLFGEFDAYGNKIRAGKIDFIEENDNPTGIYKYLMAYANKNGKFVYETYYTSDDSGASIPKKRIIGYTEKNPDLFTIIATDHIRKPKKERGFTMKENIDKLLEYHTFLRNICSFTIVDICHSNRGVSAIERLKYAKEYIYPTADDVKDSGNLAEESVILVTMFNANDEKYQLDRHFGLDLIDNGKRIFPNYRSIHIAESRYTDSPVHIQVNMYGGINTFSPLN